MDRASMVGAQSVSVEGDDIPPVLASAIGGPLVHRCAVGVPWEWRQANLFTEKDRLQVAARHMHMANLSGHHYGPSGEQVMRLFEERKPIDDDLWKKVGSEWTAALVNYQMAAGMREQPGGDNPCDAFKAARAAEVIQCLKHYESAEGCADLLYATRLAGAPLNPAAAVD